MTVIYPLQNQSDYTELRFSLRSIEKNLIGLQEVVLIGDKIPDWVVNITWIKLSDIENRKQLSIRRKILAGLWYRKTILCMADDIYFLKPTKVSPYYFAGSLKSYSESGTRPLQKQLEAMDRPIKRFDIHSPIVYEREAFNQVSEQFTENVILKSMYCNYHNIDGTEGTEYKLLTAMKSHEVRQKIKDWPYFSTGPTSLKSAIPILSELFEKKSNFEL